MSEATVARRVAIIGLGLIGGSVARGLRAAGAVSHIAGCVETRADVLRAEQLGLADSVTTSVGEAADGADMVIVAVGVHAMRGVFAQLSGVIGADATVTDVGSTKGSVIAAAREAFTAAEMTRFVPGHPVSGTENSGLEASVDGLFDGRRAILTPLPETAPEAVVRVQRLWQVMGARISSMTPGHHDEVLAATSHLPHVVAFALVDTLADMSERSEIFQYAAGGFADFTRIASSDPALWCNIVSANKDALLPALAQYIDKLEYLRQALRNDDQQALAACFERAKATRDRFTGVYQDKQEG